MKHLIPTLSVLTVLATTAHASTPDERMHQLAQESQKQKAACDQFGQEAKTLLGSENADLPWKWDDRSEKLLNLVINYPGTPKATQQARQLFNETKDAGHAFKLENIANLAACRTMDYFKSSKKLIASLPNFPKEKQDQAVQTISKQIQADLSSPGPLLEILVDGTLVEKMAQSKLTPLSAHEKEIRAALKKSLGAKSQIQKDLDNKHPDYSKVWAKEFVLSSDLSKDWLAILKK